MPIEFYCPGCGSLMRTPDATAGRKGRCPNCLTKVQIPAATLAISTRGAGANPREIPPDDAIKPEGKIEFFCSSCGRPVRVSESAAGRRGQCPSCQAVVRIPGDSGD